MDQLPFWQRLTQHPAYDAFWQGQAVDKILAARPLAVPTLLVGSLWDQEDIYGAPAAFTRSRRAPTPTSCSARGTMARPTARRPRSARSTWGGDTGKWFRGERDDPVPQPLSQGRPAGRHRAGDSVRGRHQSVATPRRLAPGVHDRLPRELDPALPRVRLPPRVRQTPAAKALRHLHFRSRQAGHLSRRPSLSPWATGSTWRAWLVDDQRFADARPDVLSYSTEPLTEPLRLAGTRSSTSSPRPAAPTAIGWSS